jgi:hypothetical protein
MNLDEYIQNLERAGGRTISEGGPDTAGLQKTRQQLEQALIPQTAVTPSFPTSLPEAGGLLLGLIPFTAPESRLGSSLLKLGEKAPAVTRPYVPSLAGSAIGTTAGTLVEQALPNQDFFSSETGKKLIENNVQNAIYDVGGNLTFNFVGKAFKVGKDVLDKTGITTTAKMFATPEQEARRAAQEYLSKYGATLTRGQLTGDITTQNIESTLKYAPGASGKFAKQQKGVEEALQAGVNDVQATLDTSDAFKMALKQSEPTQMALGDRFQAAIKNAEVAMKDKYRPVYERIDKEGDGLFVDLRPLKQQAQAELDKLAKRKFVGAGEDRASVLNEILAQDDQVALSVAHGLRSDLLAGARDLRKEGTATTAKESEYNKQAAAIQKSMDSIMVATFGNAEDKELARKLGMYGGIDSPAGLRTGQVLNYSKTLDQFLNTIGKTPANTSNNELLRSYFNAQKGYSDAMQGFYSGTVSSALKSEPSAVGEYLFNIDRPERMRETFAAIAQAEKYLPKDQSKGIKSELQFGYLNKLFGSPDGIVQFSKNMDDKTFKEGFNYLFQEPTTRKQLVDIANAAKYGLEETAGSTALRTRVVGAAVAGTSGIGYLLLPSDLQDKIDISSLTSAGVLFLTPNLMAKALTNKNAMDALAMLSKAQRNPKYAGAVSAKIADSLNKSGIIDSEYLTEINQLMSIPREGQAQQPTEPQKPIIDLDAYIKSLETQPTPQ